MALFKPIILINYLSCIILTVTLKVIWNLSLNDGKEIYLSKICSPYTGCLKNQENSCEQIKILCVGSKRCCNDCYESHTNYLKSKLIKSEYGFSSLNNTIEHFVFP